ncbi:2'-5' RNA ligase family protein [Hymenobacter endophyticus]|uniref:Mutarotase n=1 Tax=Hymenobacter endophyticus TaxID=3076335 RepID=A0ABU3TN65_9BACT|nr:mutarotase [Hymenobacter endophyticus]MDU0372821.1 mutarotase [Hymenobacter endophyticus]
MDLPEHYTAMREATVHRLLHEGADPDPLLHSPQDTRRGITLLARPPAAITAAIEDILADFRAIEPGQYYYPASDVHLTILSIISCYPGFTLTQIDPAAYCQAIRQITRRVRPFRIRYEGLTASPGGIMVQGFPEDDGLENLREATREFFRHSSLQQSIDARYSIHTAHSTVIRFTQPLTNAPALVARLAQHQDRYFGTFEVDAVELVYNDWYQRGPNTVLLEKYALSRS